MLRGGELGGKTLPSHRCAARVMCESGEGQENTAHNITVVSNARDCLLLRLHMACDAAASPRAPDCKGLRFKRYSQLPVRGLGDLNWFWVANRGEKTGTL